MSDTAIDNTTSQLDQAQQTNNVQNTDYLNKVQQFISNTLAAGIIILICSIFSFYLIYFCKLAHSNVLPIDINCYPYTKNEPKINYLPINIFSNAPFTSPRESMKIKFPDYKNLFVDSWLRPLRDYKANQTSGFFGNFCVSVIESTIVNIYNYYDSILSFFNSLPEFLLVILGPLAFIITIILGVFCGIFSFIFHWLRNLPWMMKKNTSIIIDTDGEVYYKCGYPQWSPVRWDSPDPKKPNEGEWKSCILGVFLQIMVGFLLFSLVGFLPFISVGINIFCIISFFSYNVQIGNSVDDLKDSSVNELFTYFYKYHKINLMILFSYNLLTNAYKYLGGFAAAICLVIIIAIYFSKAINMFIAPKGIRTPMVDDERPTRGLCPTPDITGNCVTPTSILDGKFTSKSQLTAEAQATDAKQGLTSAQMTQEIKAMGSSGMGMGMGSGMGMGMGSGMGMGMGTGMGSGTGQYGGKNKKMPKIKDTELIKKIKKFNKKYGKFLI
jgi:hypothetical protein